MISHGALSNILPEVCDGTPRIRSHTNWHRNKQSVTRSRDQSSFISMAYYMGMDFGTSGARLTVIDGEAIFSEVM
jgi:hypothetical protein